MLERALGSVPTNKQKNTIRTRFGPIAVAKTNLFSAPVLGSRTSPYLQAKLVLLAAKYVCAHVSPLVESLLDIRVYSTGLPLHLSRHPGAARCRSQRA